MHSDEKKYKCCHSKQYNQKMSDNNNGNNIEKNPDVTIDQS